MIYFVGLSCVVCAWGMLSLMSQERSRQMAEQEILARQRQKKSSPALLSPAPAPAQPAKPAPTKAAKPAAIATKSKH